MKSELESVQAELVKYGCDPISGKCLEKEQSHTNESVFETLKNQHA